jgi:uncharacterized protein
MTGESLHLVRLADVPRQPWRNGGGTTQELLAWPSPEAWELRLSVASIESDGPFSAYPGVWREFTVLRGAGVRLAWSHRAEVLTPEHEPIGFDGAEPPACTLLAGATQDLNLMIRRDAGRGRLWHAAPGAPCAGTGRSALRGVFALDACTLRCGEVESLALDAGSLVWSSASNAQAWSLLAAGETPRAFWLDFEPTPGAPA